MIRCQDPRPRSRSGITLTEILISIMIMGIGLLSLATLFPLGLLRIREANRASRSARLIESAIGDLQGRNLLNKQLFYAYWYGQPMRPAAYDPFIYDPMNPNDLSITGGVNHTYGKGLPIAYDPLWWYETWVNSNGLTTPVTAATIPGARFANGIGWVRNDPNPGGSSPNPSAYGLQRITNFAMAAGPEIEKTFASTDDIVFQTEGKPLPLEGIGSPLVPDMSAGGIMVDLSYTWIFTGRQDDATNDTVFEGDIVVFHNRPFGLQQVTAPISGSTTYQARGETVVEAIFGYGPPPKGGGYALSNTTVLLRWPTSMPDPDVRVGGYIADVTYEQYATEATFRFDNFATRNPLNQEIYPAQRCYWYRITKRTDATSDGSGYRQMVVNINTPLRAKTFLNGSGQPIHVNAALVSPYVVNVVPRTFYIR